jgi:hypothetical protein
MQMVKNAAIKINNPNNIKYGTMENANRNAAPATNNSNSTVDDKRARFQNTFLAYVIFAAIAAYTCQPLLKFVNPAIFGFGGVAVGLCVVSAYRATVLGAGSKNLIVCTIAGMLGCAAIFYSAAHAIQASNKNDDICRSVQAKIHVGDIFDEKASAAFSALGCRPQYDEKIIVNNR